MVCRCQSWYNFVGDITITLNVSVSTVTTFAHYTLNPVIIQMVALPDISLILPESYSKIPAFRLG
jgi:hypothetical protein